MEINFDKYRSRTWAEVDLDAIMENYNISRRKLPHDTELCAVIKADAYGHGAGVLGPWMEKLGDIDLFAVAAPAEAVELKKAGVTKDILILGYTDPIYFEELLTLGGIIVSLYSVRDAAALADAASAVGAEYARCYLALDTGMGRIGFPCNIDGVKEAATAAKTEKIKAEGIFSHFACADTENRGLTEIQETSLSVFVTALGEQGVTGLKKSIYNSAAIVVPTTGKGFDVARLGIMLYGVRTSRVIPTDGFIPAMQFKTRVVRVEKIAKGNGISYGHTYITNKDTTVATLCVGYADGYPRALSNKGEVIIRGRKCPVIGRVCMDMMMVDASDVDGVSVGDEVILFGRGGDVEIRSDDIAESIGTIAHEVLCGITSRVPRIYTHGGKDVDVYMLR